MWIEAFISQSLCSFSPGVPGLACASRATLILSSTTAAFLPLLPFQPPATGGTNHWEAPAIVSCGILSAYHAFVVSIMFAFTCSFSAGFLERKPAAATILRLSAITWLSSALLLLLYLVFVDRFA